MIDGSNHRHGPLVHCTLKQEWGLRQEQRGAMLDAANQRPGSFCTDEVEACDGEAPAASQGDRHPRGQRRFRPEFHELSENGMSELSAACDSAGLRQLFLAAMKL